MLSFFGTTDPDHAHFKGDLSTCIKKIWAL